MNATEVRKLGEVAQFLLLRMDGGSDWVGASSNAMVKAALKDTEVEQWDYPQDLSDLSRCCATFARAPQALKELMLPTLTKFCEHLRTGKS